MCIEYHIQVNVYHVSAQSDDERMINVYYCYYQGTVLQAREGEHYSAQFLTSTGQTCQVIAYSQLLTSCFLQRFSYFQIISRGNLYFCVRGNLARRTCLVSPSVRQLRCDRGGVQQVKIQSMNTQAKVSGSVTSLLSSVSSERIRVKLFYELVMTICNWIVTPCTRKYQKQLATALVNNVRQGHVGVVDPPDCFNTRL